MLSADLESHKVLEGALAIQPLAAYLKGFDAYLANLTVENHDKQNPWFREYVKYLFNCDFKNSTFQSTNQTQVSMIFINSIRCIFF